MVDLRRYEKLHTIQMLKDVVRRWWGVELAFADARGYVLDHADGKIIPPNNEFCKQALFSKDGFKRCNESVREIRDLNRPPTEGARRSIVHRCHLGFELVACPIELDGALQGFIFVGGALTTPLGPQAAEELITKIRTLEPNAKAPNVDSIRVVLPKEIDQLRDLLEFGATQIEQVHAEAKARQREREAIQAGLSNQYRFESIVGNSRAMQQVFRLLEKIIPSDSTILIHGESGTGKELVARAIHHNGPRAKQAFVVQNCSAFNDNLLESALFGHCKGAFTGAIKDKKGLFEIADGGTFFLDEIGDMSAALQVKLLRVLQEGTFTPVGGTEQRQVDVRVIAATHKDLQRMVERGEFREDLYYRINVIKVVIPPLRERMEDLPVLADFFVRKHFRGKNGRPPPLAPEAMVALSRYAWPGNIRELENEIERLLVLCGDLDELPADLLSQRVREATGAAVRAQAVATQTPPAARGSVVGAMTPAGTLKDAVEYLEREMIRQGLIRTHWNKSQLAKELGISRSNLIMKVERYGLERGGGES